VALHVALVNFCVVLVDFHLALRLRHCLAWRRPGRDGIGHVALRSELTVVQVGSLYPRKQSFDIVILVH
jgi:hypothetical protein